MNARLRVEAKGLMSAAPEVIAGRPQLMRAMNEELLVNALRRNGPLTRADLTQLSGLSKPTVGLALANLEANGLLGVVGQRSGSRGPAAALYGVHPDAGYVLSLDVGSEYVRGALADLSGAVRARGQRSVHAASTKERMSGLVDLADELAERAGVARGSVTQTIVGSPGVYDHQRDALVLALGLPGWQDPGVLGELRRAFGEETLVENDVNLAALAERDHGHGRDVESFAFVSVGTGVGMGLVLNGRLHTGEHGAAGEVGFLPLGTPHSERTPDARRRGMLEASASAAGVVRAARAKGMRGRLNAHRVFDLAASGDWRAKAVVAETASLIARALAAVVAVADPSLIVLGGGIGSASLFADAVSTELHRIVPIAPDVKVSAIAENAVADGGIVAGVDAAWRRLLSGT